MHIYYNSDSLRPDLEKISSKDFSLTFEKKIPLREVFEEVGRTHRGKAMGFVPDYGFIDLGRYVIAVISKPEFTYALAGRVAGSAAWEGIKAIYCIYKKSDVVAKKSRLDQMVLVTDNFGVDGAKRTMFFTFEKNLTEDQFETAIASISEIRVRAHAFFDLVLVHGSHDVIEFKFTGVVWQLINSDSYRSTSGRYNLLMNTVKSIAAVLAGFLSVVILSVGTDKILEASGVFPPPSEMGLYVTWMLIVAFIYRSIYAVVGGYITAWLAPSNPKRHVMVLGILGLIGGAGGVVAGWNLSSHWYPIALFLTAYPLVWLGGKLRIR